MDDEDFRRLYPALRRFAAVAVDSDMDPDDVLQEALVGMLRSKRLISDPEAYLRRSVLNTIENLRRQRSRRPQTALGEEHDRAAAPTNSSDALSVLQEVSAVDRSILYMVDVEGRSSGETARALGLTAVAVRARASRARRFLRSRIDQTKGPSND